MAFLRSKWQEKVFGFRKSQFALHVLVELLFELEFCGDASGLGLARITGGSFWDIKGLFGLDKHFLWHCLQTGIVSTTTGLVRTVI